MRITTPTNWLNGIKQYGRQFNDVLEIYEESNTIYVSTTPLGTFDRDDINRIEYSIDSDMLKSEMGMLVVDINKSSSIFNLLKENRMLRYKLQLLDDSGNVIDTCDYKYFIVTKIEEQKDSKSVLVTCYDEMIKTMTNYVDLGITYPITLQNYVNTIAQHFNWGLAYGIFSNLSNQVIEEHYVDVDGNFMGYTFRDVLNDIAEAVGCQIKFYVDPNTNQKLLLLKKFKNNTNTTINEDYFNDKNVNLGKKFGPVNTLVLSRANTDNIYWPSTLPENPVEFKISDNPILEQTNRDDFKQGILDEINGLEFYTNEFDTKGLCIYEIGDTFNVSIDSTTYPCILLHDNMKRTTGLKENIYTKEPQQSVTEYKYASNSDKLEINSRNAYIIANKSEGKIEQIVSAVGDNGEVTSASIVQSINDSGSQIKLNANKVYINGVTFDDQNNMTINDGDINLIDSGTSVSSKLIITSENNTHTKETRVYSGGIVADERKKDGTERNTSYLTPTQVNVEYTKPNTNEYQGVVIAYHSLDVSKYNFNDTSQNQNIQIHPSFITMSKGTNQSYQEILRVDSQSNAPYMEMNGATTINGNATFSGTITAKKSSGDTFYTASRTDIPRMAGFGIGGTGAVGIYDWSLNKWLFVNNNNLTSINGNTSINGDVTISGVFDRQKTLGCKELNNLVLDAGLTNLNDLGLGNTGTWRAQDSLTNKPCDAGRCYCFKGFGEYQVQIAFKYNANGIYIRHYYGGVWSSWTDTLDTGWVNCTTSQGTWTYCQVRRIGKVVHFRAHASSLGSPSGLIITIPSGYRPSQNESAYGFNGWVSTPTISRWYFNTDGNCGCDWTLSLVNGTQITENTWKRIDATWFID